MKEVSKKVLARTRAGNLFYSNNPHSKEALAGGFLHSKSTFQSISLWDIASSSDPGSIHQKSLYFYNLVRWCSWLSTSV